MIPYLGLEVVLFVQTRQALKRSGYEVEASAGLGSGPAGLTSRSPVLLGPGGLELPVPIATSMEMLLGEISRANAPLALLDITGVPVVDTAVANALQHTAEACRMLGSDVILVGISPAVAQIITQLGVDLSHLVTRSDLQSGLEYALRRLGRMVISSAQWRMSARSARSP
jgi:anti-anti-sigma regulatory factor